MDAKPRSIDRARPVQRGAGDAIQKLLAIVQTRAEALRDGSPKEIPAAARRAPAGRGQPRGAMETSAAQFLRNGDLPALPDFHIP